MLSGYTSAMYSVLSFMEECMAQNMDVAALQAALRQSGEKWQADTTALTALAPQQKQLRLGANPPGGLQELQQREQTASIRVEVKAIGTYPAAFDLRDVNGGDYITAVKDQGGCGSCVAFGSTATVEGTFRWQRGNPSLAVDLSEAQLFYCIAESQGRNCGNGWWPDNALDGYKNVGIADEACFPYTAGDQVCKLCGDWQGRAIKITGWHTISNTADMKTWLSTRGPLDTCFTVYDDFFSYRSGVYSHMSGDVAGGHCVCVVGYNDSLGCWICKNSWGTSWGQSGFFQIAYGQCGIDATMWAVEGILETMWLNSCTVGGLWTIDQDYNAWAYLNGIGWRKIANDNDNIFYDLLSQLTAAKTANRPCNVYEDQGVIKQIYVL